MSTTIKRPNSKPHSKPKNGVLAAQKTSIVPEESMEEDSMEEDEEQELESDENEGSEDEDDENGYEQEEYEPLDDDDSLDDVFGMEGLDDEPEPLSKEALEAYQAAQARAGVIYISRIPPGMNPNKVRHLMSAYGEIGRVFLQQEDAKRAYLRKKYTTTKKPQYTEGWVEFKDKKIARATAEMLNAQPIGGKKGNRWRDDVWTMKYLPRFKWGMLTEQIAQERAMHAARLRMELSQSKREQKHYLKQVEIGKSLEKREMKRKRQEQQAEDGSERSENKRIKLNGNGDANGDGDDNDKVKKKHKHRKDGSGKPSVTVSSSNPSNTDKSKYKDLDSVLGSIF